MLYVFPLQSKTVEVFSSLPLQFEYAESKAVGIGKTSAHVWHAFERAVVQFMQSADLPHMEFNAWRDDRCIAIGLDLSVPDRALDTF